MQQNTAAPVKPEMNVTGHIDLSMKPSVRACNPVLLTVNEARQQQHCQYEFDDAHERIQLGLQRDEKENRKPNTDNEVVSEMHITEKATMA